ncbi:MAG TPA: hypothetical protein VF493_12390 [Terriglobales bacterium]
MGTSGKKPKQKKSRKKEKKQAPAEVIDQTRAGMPAKDNVREVVDAVSPEGKPFRILKTTEMDAYDKPKRRRSGS